MSPAIRGAIITAAAPKPDKSSRHWSQCTLPWGCPSARVIRERCATSELDHGYDDARATERECLSAAGRVRTQLRAAKRHLKEMQQSRAPARDAIESDRKVADKILKIPVFEILNLLDLIKNTLWFKSYSTLKLTPSRLLKPLL